MPDLCSAMRKSVLSHSSMVRRGSTDSTVILHIVSNSVYRYMYTYRYYAI